MLITVSDSSTIIDVYVADLAACAVFFLSVCLNACLDSQQVMSLLYVLDLQLDLEQREQFDTKHLYYGNVVHRSLTFTDMMSVYIGAGQWHQVNCKAHLCA